MLPDVDLPRPIPLSLEGEGGAPSPSRVGERGPGGEVLLLLLLLVAGCEAAGSSHVVDLDLPDADADAVAEFDADTGPAPELLFAVSVTESVGAKGGPDSAYAGAGRSWEWEPSFVAATSGDCALVKPVEPPFCDPPCDLGTVCVADDTCGPPHQALGAGDIVLTGLKVGCTLVPETQYHYYSPKFAPEPQDGDVFDEGDLLTATAPGDDVPAFSVTTRGVARVVTPLACPPVLEAGAGLDVSWTPGAQAGDRVAFVLQSGNHGGQFSRVLCEIADTGSLHVDAALLDAYLTEWRPVESWSLARWHEDHVDHSDVRVTFTASSLTGCRW